MRSKATPSTTDKAKAPTPPAEPTPSAEPARTGRRPLLWPAVLVAALTLVTFSRTLTNEFVNWDDLIAIQSNPWFNPPTGASLKHYWGELDAHNEFYVPINYTVWWLLAHVSRGPDGAGNPDVIHPWPFHAVNWLAHAANGVLVLVILYRLTRSRPASTLGALLFSLHPLQAEPVAWASSMYSSLSGLFSLLAVWQYLKFSDGREERAADGARETERAATHPRRRPWLHFVLASVAYAAALLTKPTAVVVPGMVVVIELFIRGRRVGQLVLPMCIWALMTLPTVVLARVSQHDTPAFSPPAASRVLVALDSLAFYLQKLVLPVGLASDYGRSPRWLLLEGPAYYTWMIPAAVGVIAWAVRRQAPWVLGCLALFVAALFPSLGLVPFDYQRYSTVADRYAYLALLAPAAALALALARRPAPALLALAGVATGALAVLANLQTRHWRNTDTLFVRALAVNPRSLAAHTNFGFEYFKAGKVDKAMEAYAIALEANPGDLRVLFDLGNLHLHQGRPAEAVEAYRQAIGRAGHRAALRGNLGLALAQLGFENEAVTELREAIRLDPNYAQAHTNLATLLRARGDSAGARHHYEEALRVDPSIEAARKGLEEMKAAGK